MFISDTMAQTFAYASVLLLIAGMVLLVRNRPKFPPLIKIWVVFYILYYTFGILANIYLETEPPLLKTLVPIVYFLGFAFLLNNPDEQVPVGKILALSFFTSCILLIWFNFINFSLDFSGIYQYKLERAGGVYGDANNSCVAAILSFVFLKYMFKPDRKLGRFLKTMAMLISVYGIIITFSKTGFIVFLLVLGIVYHKFFSPQRLIFTIISLPIGLYLLANWALTSNALSLSQKERIGSLTNIVTLNTDNIGFSNRDVLFNNMMGFIYENPFIGNGINFSTTIRGHNTIFGIWADSGIIVFLLFLFLLIYYFKRALLSTTTTKFFSLSVLITLSLFMLTLQSIINQGYLMVVFVFIGYLVHREEQLVLSS
jgi:hypothetical protein